MPTVANETCTALRRTGTPYKGYVVIFGAITVLSAVVAIRTGEWNIMWSAVGIWASFGTIVYFGLRYMVLWDESGVVMRASGLPERRIRYEEITGVAIERARANEFFAQARPFRRVVVYGDGRQPSTFVDISLRHFRPQDIDRLLDKIRARRPDLSIPAIPWGTGSL